MSAVAVVETFRVAISQASGGAELDRLTAAIWRQNLAGALSDDDANGLAMLASAKRKPVDEPRRASVPVDLSRFKPRRRQTSPDREASKRRRRGLARSAPMPAALASLFTESESAALAIVAGEVKHHGACELPIDKLAALAGVCRTSAQNALHEARRLGIIKITHRPQRGRKHLPNRVEIVSPEWRTWLKRGPTAHRPIGSKTISQGKNLNPTKSTEKTERALFSFGAQAALSPDTLSRHKCVDVADLRGDDISGVR
ncbi:hypothetical protein [Ancylobacter rudongensis]|uniref:Helix-turn-helix domain-containing protein n=1 Tax=Ancylobacter rudongensis TaxID=177413 RepID=A0A1G4PNS9_9HYPH|nr:hypothetical protein [Ancylobacter rudongensis]SCW33994.1 hypothetical protein SAMN05660859_0682 [Ancylobacter rudongensis]